MRNELRVAVLGLGEAGSHFANDLSQMGVIVTGYDPKPIRQLNDAVTVEKSNLEAAQDADIILSVNLSSVSIRVAEEIKEVLKPHQFFCEMNTSGPEKKQKIATILAPCDAKIVDLAIMAPVPPKGILTPLLASGKFAGDFLTKINPLNLDISMVENGQIGDAATRKLLRSIVYKGIAAVICEATEAGKVFGMENYIRAQICSLIGGDNDLINRFIEGSHTHAIRRMQEMEAVVEMLEAQGVEPIVTRATRNNLEKLSQ